jgi:hypothetical protein
MTKLATRRAVLAGGCKRACNQGAPTNLKSLHHKPRAGGAFGAGLSIIYRITNAKRITDIQKGGPTSRY